MTKKYMLLTFMQGICSALFIKFLTKYIENQTPANFILLLMLLYGIIDATSAIKKEDTKNE